MKKEEMRLNLINATIRIIAREGLDKATTKSIANEAGLNEVYIYRNFKDKEDLFVKAYELLDRELLDTLMSNISIMTVDSIDFIDRCRLLFEKLWDFMVGNSDRCLCYVRYFYSPYFAKYSIESHRLAYDHVVELFTPSFTDDADVWMILNHILDVIMSFAVKVHTGQLENDEGNRYHVFNVIYQSVSYYLRCEQNKNTMVV